MKKAVLIGTSHSIQRNDRAFGSYIEELCNEHNICAIAEEIDNKSKSIAAILSDKLGIKYAIVEPTPDERRNLHIERENDIVYELTMKYSTENLSTEPSSQNWPSEPYDDYANRVQTTYRQREGEWIKRIENLNIWPVLIICGKDHLEDFSKLFISSGIDLEPAFILTY